jgi:hypothetical protein
MTKHVDSLSSVVCLAQSDEIADSISLYLRLLYSREAGELAKRLLAEGAISETALRWLRTVDFERLGQERRARAAQLRHQLTRSSPRFAALTEGALFKSLIELYCDSPELWSSRGRSLAESFCLFAARVLRERGERFLADVAMLDGVLSGFPEKPDVPSPWENAGRHERVENAIVTGRLESLDSQFRLLDLDGELPSAARRDECSEVRATRIFIAVDASTEVTIMRIDP